MALIKCPECGKEISDSAKQCPHCGFTLKTNIDTAKQVASVAGNAVRNVVLKYGESIIPMALLLVGVAYLIIGALVGFYHNYNYNAVLDIIETPFEDIVGFWIPLLMTIILPIVSLIICKKYLKKLEETESITIQESKLSKHVVLWMVLIYVVTFVSLSFIFYKKNNDAKWMQQCIRDFKSEQNASSITKWIYHGDENIVGARIHYATISSQEDESITLNLTYDPDNYIEVNDLVAKYFDKSIDIVSSRATIKRGIAFKFDDGGVISLTPSTNPSNDVYITDKSISIRDESADFNRLMSLLKTSKVCKIEITTSKGIITYTFNVAGLKWPAF